MRILCLFVFVVSVGWSFEGSAAGRTSRPVKSKPPVATCATWMTDYSTAGSTQLQPYSSTGLDRSFLTFLTKASPRVEITTKFETSQVLQVAETNEDTGAIVHTGPPMKVDTYSADLHIMGLPTTTLYLHINFPSQGPGKISPSYSATASSAKLQVRHVSPIVSDTITGEIVPNFIDLFYRGPYTNGQRMIERYSAYIRNPANSVVYEINVSVEFENIADRTQVADYASLYQAKVSVIPHAQKTKE